MNNKKEFNLLSDLAKLINKYGPEVFEGLALELSNPTFMDQLVEILRKSATVGRRSPKRRKGPRSPSSIDFRSTLTRVDRVEAERAALLTELYDALRTKSVLPTLRAMKDFALDNGLPPIKATSRDKALTPFVRSFLRMPAQEVREYLRRIQPSPSSDDRTLEGWSKIIFGSNDRASKN